MRRRDLLAGGAATLAAPVPVTEAGLQPLFDAVARELDRPPAGPWAITVETSEDAATRFGAPARALTFLRASRPARLAPEAARAWRTVEDGLAREAALAGRFPFGAAPGRPYVISSRDGLHRRAASGLGRAPRADEADAYVAALNALARGLDAETRRLRQEAREHNALLPRPLLNDLAARIAGLASQASASSPLATAAPPAWRVQAAARVDTDVRPALARQAAELTALADLAPEAAGAWSLRDGGAYYALALRAGSGLDASPAEAQRIARTAAQSLLADLDQELRTAGLTQGSTDERLRRLAADPSGLAEDSDAGRDAAVALMAATLGQARATLGEVTTLSAGDVAIRRMSPADEAAGRAGYREATANGGTYFPDLHDVRARPPWTLPTVALHETLPGHLLQLPRQLRRAPHPLVARYATGAFEGWAVYAETLGDKLGLLSGRDRIGYLQSMLFRLSRAIVDAGMHLHRWTPARAKAEMAALYGFPLFNSFDAELERICTAPGSGGADAFGRLRLLRLRTAFPDLRRFHDMILRDGPAALATPPRHPSLTPVSAIALDPARSGRRSAGREGGAAA